MDKQLTRRGQIVFLLATITDRQIKVKPIPAFIWVWAAAKGGQIQKSVFVLLVMFSSCCEGLNVEDKIRLNPAHTPPPPPLPLGRLLTSQCAEGKLCYSSPQLTHEETAMHSQQTHKLTHTSPSYVHFSCFRSLSFLLPDTFQTKHPQTKTINHGYLCHTTWLIR